MNRKNLLSLLLTAILIAVSCYWASVSGYSQTEVRAVGLLVFAACFWIFEPIPIFATSMVIILAEVLLISDRPLVIWVVTDDSQVLNYQEIFATLASPIIILFLGGFFLAMAATKYRLDQNLARILLKPFGGKVRTITLGLMVITAFFSMFMSNTATTVMMLSILSPVVASLGPESRAKTGLVLCIPLAANIGGIGTPIGTPPNAIALKYLIGADVIGFGQWMAMAVPYVVVLLVFAWVLLGILYPSGDQRINLEIKGQFLKNPKAYLVYGTFAGTILLWLTDFIHGLNAYTVAMIPVVIFLAFGIISREELRNISWDVLWLVAGGIALGLALDKTGLAQHLMEGMSFDELPTVAIVVVLALVATIMANFMSNTATANLLLPLVAVLGVTLPGLVEMGGTKLIVLSTTLACSMGMALPISTPPNALAFGTGHLKTSDLAKSGLIVASVGLLLNFVLMAILKSLNFF